MKPFGAQHRRHRLGRDRIIDGNAGQLREALRSVARLRNRGAYAIDPDHAHRPPRARRDDRLVLGMRLQRELLRPVGLHQHIVR